MWWTFLSKPSLEINNHINIHHSRELWRVENGQQPHIMPLTLFRDRVFFRLFIHVVQPSSSFLLPLRSRIVHSELIKIYKT
jgi:hypothetical protein